MSAVKIMVSTLNIMLFSESENCEDSHYFMTSRIVKIQARSVKMKYKQDKCGLNYEV